ncbi:MAG TPA: hypothetical protein DCG41_02715, partial [Verrucomicrobiales bacterium]|nr:hypothetical protein [Verrucomicrobiales bacterium]
MAEVKTETDTLKEATEGITNPQLLYDTNPPEIVSEELQPIIDELGLSEACEHLAKEGWAVIEDAATPEFNEALRNKILEQTGGEMGGGNMQLRKDPIFAQAALNPKLMAMAEFSVGRGFLLSQFATSVSPKGSPGIGLHADANWMPAPLPEFNMLLTCCWATDEYTKENGATLIIPGTKELRRHPTEEEAAAKDGAIAINCPAGSVAMWDGNTWHASWPRTAEGERVVAHITYTRLMCRPIEDYSSIAD